MKNHINQKLSDLKIPTDYSLETEGVSQSLISSFLFCRVAWLIGINRFRKKSTGSTTGFGSMFHDLLDKLYSGWRDKQILPSDDEIAEWVESFITNHSDELSGKDEATIEREAVIAEVLLSEYIKFYSDDFESKKVILIEEVFTGMWKGFKLRGKMDGLLQSKDGKNWLFEHKTKGRINENAIKMILKFDFQSLFYIKAIESQHDIEVSGVLYNIIRNPSIGKKVKSLKELRKLIRKEVKKNPKHFFKRYQEVYTKTDKKRFSEQLLGILTDMKNVLTGKSKVYRNQNSCQGMWSCGHLESCNKNQLAFYDISETLFTELSEEAASEKNKRKRTKTKKNRIFKRRSKS